MAIDRKMFLTTTITLLLTCWLAAVFNVQSVNAWDGTLYIRADGSVDPLDAPITTSDNITYTLTDNIKTPLSADGIVVERDNIIIDGNGYTIQGTGSNKGIALSGRVNVIVQNVQIEAFYHGIYLYSSSNNTISKNNITANNGVGVFLYFSSNNTILDNNIANNYHGVWIYSSSYNKISNNNITANNVVGVELHSSSNNTVSANNIANNTWAVYLPYALNNIVSANNLAKNNASVYINYSYNNIVSNNNVTNSYYGVDLRFSLSNTVSGNNIANNEYGIRLRSSLYNIIYHNNFSDNALNAYASSTNSSNYWDTGIEGNYWSDYQKRYPNATEIDGTGIWNTPYVINELNQDCYPIIPEFRMSLITLILLMEITVLTTIICKKRIAKNP